MKKQMRTVSLVLVDIIIISINVVLALLIRFGFEFDQIHLETLIKYLPQIVIIKLIIFAYFNLYKSLWKYASIDELMQIFNGVVVANAATVTFLFLMRIDNIPRSIVLLIGILDLLVIGGSRLSYRILRRVNQKYLTTSHNKKRVLIIGAGDAGMLIGREIISHGELNSYLVGFLDDDVLKHGKKINGVEVLGETNLVNVIIEKEKIEEVIVALPSVKNTRIKEILKLIDKLEIKVMILPHMGDILSGKAHVSDLREVSIEDLLGRDAVDLDINSIKEFIEEKTILVTGGGGSIGSEICRQVSKYSPKKLIIFDIYENNVYDIQNELKRKYKEELNLDVVIGSVRDKIRVEEVIKENNIDVIFHAAAHKHVPLMERSPKEAIKNNVFGTKNVAETASKYNVPKFVLVSTDKAVNPTNIMGATKRVAEMTIQKLNETSKTEFVAVRFGNVLGSNGSVIPLFKRQIKEGGPVTVTHEEVIRYFMTIPEASQLVIQAGALASGGEIFILDMGEPTRILDLAKDLIKLSGLRPYEDIDIEITGLRPGEKMYEELLLNEDNNIKTDNKKIFIEKHEEINNQILNELDELKKNINDISDKNLYNKINKLTNNFQYTREFN